MLLRQGGHTLLPELFDVVGDELFIRLLDTFSGDTFVFPSEKELKRYSKEVDIYVRVKQAEVKHREMERLAFEYVCTYQNIQQTYARMSKIIDEAQIQL
jgi:hypothetical protein